MAETSTTLDGILNGRVALEQPVKGYRVAIDTVLLASAVPALRGDRILDLGCGVGGAMICVAARVAGVEGLGLDVQGELVALAYRNIKRNDFASGLEAKVGDATSLPSELRGTFDHVLMNPPFHSENGHDVSPDKSKRMANTEKEGDLSLWLRSAEAALKTSGTLTLIHRADREADILLFLGPSFGEIDLLPLLPKESATPKRLIVRARKNAPLVNKRCNPLILHKDPGGYTEEAEALLRGGKDMPFR